MKILIVKLSSMGDILHALPAVYEAFEHLPTLEIDWVVEEAFKDIPSWLTFVNRVIPIRFRAWRKEGYWKNRQEIRTFIKDIRKNHYDKIIDLQGLVKSAWIGQVARGESHGLDISSAREGLAAILYRKHHRVPFAQHAILRARQLMATALAYPLKGASPQPILDIKPSFSPSIITDKPKLLLCHGTTWQTKKWPLEAWQNLALRLEEAGYFILLPSGNPQEQIQAKTIAGGRPSNLVLPPLGLSELAYLMTQSQAVIAVDTGLGHLAAALGSPSLSLYGPTNPEHTGTLGKNQEHYKANLACVPCLQNHCRIAPKASYSPCMESLSVDTVYDWVLTQVSKKQ